MTTPVEQLEAKGKAARAASKRLATLSTDIKNQALRNIAADLLARQDEILRANEADLKAARASGMGAAMLDRLLLNQGRLEGMAHDVLAVAALPDPVGEVFDMRTLSNGLLIGRKRFLWGLSALSTRAGPT